MTFESWLQARGFDPAVLTETQRTALLAMYQREHPPTTAATNPATPPPLPGAQSAQPPRVPDRTIPDILASARGEEERKRKITEMVAEYVTEQPSLIDTIESLSRQAIEGKWTVEQFELTALRARRPAGPLVTARQPDKKFDPDVIEAAVCISGGLENIDKHFSEQVLEASHRRWRHGLSLGDLVMTFATRNGYEGMSLKANLQSALRAAFSQPTQEVRAAAWGPSTGGGLSGVLSNVANKFLRAGFDAVDQGWRQIAFIRSVTDFKTITSYSLTGGMTYEPLPPGGEIKHGQVGAESYTNKIDTYARMLGIDRRDLINDDLGALTGVSRRLGRGGAMKVNNVVWTIFLNNSAFFTSGRGNVSTGAGSALSIEGLDAAYQKFMAQTDPDGEPLGATPAILLVPTALKPTADQLMGSTVLNQVPASNAAVGDKNPWAGMFRTATSPYMSNATYTGYSTTAWYLLADPNDIAVVEVAFLNGQESPTVESADADFNMLGIALRGYHDLGAALQEYRGGVRSAGS